MALRPIASRRSLFTALALCASLGAALAVGTSGSERLVTSGFDTALSSREAPLKAAAAQHTASAPSVSLAQSEEFWLRNGHRSGDVKPIAWSGQIVPGDRITIARGGSEAPRVLEVVETSPVSLDTTRLDASEPGARLLAVSCREVDRADTPLIRLIVSEGAFPLVVSSRADKAL